MSQETELKMLRDELETLQRQTRRSRRFVAVSFAILLLIVAMSLVYAFVQQVEAVRNAELARQQRDLAETARIEAGKNAEEARKQEAIAHEQRLLAEQTLADCLKKKK